jgi:hypothetical protein
MLKLRGVVHSRVTVDRNIHNPAEGIAVIDCQLLPDRGLSEPAFHWRLKNAIPPPLDISIGMNDGRLRRIKIVLSRAPGGMQSELMGAVSQNRSGVPMFSTELWKPKEQLRDFSDQFTDEAGVLSIGWVERDDLLLCLNAGSSGPLLECDVHDSLSVIFDDASQLVGVIIKNFTADEKCRLEGKEMSGTGG